MFGKRYTFETSQTRRSRLLWNAIAIFAITFIIFTTLCVYIPIHAKRENQLTKEFFFQKTPDMIAVFTGDRGRIGQGIELAKKYPEAKFFISGVDSRNSYKTLLEYQSPKDINDDPNELLQTQATNLELDYLSRNTLENVLSTLRYLRKDPTNHKDIIIISSDYHILRIQLYLNKILEENDQFTFYFQSIPSNYSSFRSIKILFSEIVKLFKATMVVIFWDN